MKYLLSLVCILFSGSFLFGQDDFKTLPQALKDPEFTTAIVFSPKDYVGDFQKFYKRKNKFVDFQTAYIKEGFGKEQLDALVQELSTTDISEVIFECDAVTESMATLSRLTNVTSFTLINPGKLSSIDKQQIENLPGTELVLKQTGASVDFTDVSLPTKTEELSLLVESIIGFDNLIFKIKELPNLESLTIAVNEIKDIPPGLDKLARLKHLAVIKTTDLSIADEDLLLQPFWLSTYNNLVSNVLNVDYLGSTHITDNEKGQLLTAFPNSSFITKPSLENKDNNEKQTAVTMSPSRLINEELFASSSSVTPFIPKAETRRAIYSVDAEKNTAVQYNSGTLIKIPENAFTDENGNLVKGAIDISYREMKTPAEIILAGVPMAYDSAGEIHQFQSAGNFEIQAAQNGKPLKLAEGKEIQLDFASADTAGGYNLYQLDPKTKNWGFQNTVNNTTTENIPQKTSVDTSWTVDTADANTRKTKYPFDISTFDERFYSSNHVYLQDSGTQNKWMFTKNYSLLGYQILQKDYGGVKINSKKYLLKVKVVSTKGVKKDSTYPVGFYITQRMFEKKNNKFFPELKEFNNKAFYTSELMNNKEFRKNYVKNKIYYDIRIEYNKGDDYCFVHLKDSNGITTVECDITGGVKGRNATYKKRNFYNRYKRYKRILDKREKEFDMQMDNNKRIYRNRINFNMSSNATGITGNIYKSLSVSGLGVYNCDQIARLESPIVSINNVKISTENGEVIKPTILYVIDKKVNGVLTYWESYGMNKVSLNKNNTITVLGLDENENMYYTKIPVAQALNGSTFTMQSIDKNAITSTSQFQDILGL